VTGRPATGGTSVPVELSRDPRFGRRVVRLVAVSAVALGVIWGLAIARLSAPPAVGVALFAGWLLMPVTLAASLRDPRLRFGLVVPASLVTLGLLAVCAGWLPESPLAAWGWVLVTAGVAVGGGLGMWLWYRLLPVPDALHDPFSRPRWALIGVHVGLVVAGCALAALAR
jgi:hypothetical protein